VQVKKNDLGEHFNHSYADRKIPPACNEIGNNYCIESTDYPPGNGFGKTDKMTSLLFREMISLL